MSGLVVVSNRGPLSFRLDADGRPEPAGVGGGLAGTLRPLLAGTGTTWVASSMSEADRLASEAGLMTGDGLRVVIVSPDPDQYRMAYDVVSNATLWFTAHELFDLPRRPVLDRRWREAWVAYRALNRQFAEAVAAEAGEGDVVLVQDYHLFLTGAMLAELRPDLRTVHFTHTPFAEPSSLRTLPTEAAGELLAGMAGFGACGFHSWRWEAAFRRCFADPALAEAAGTDQPPTTFVAPLGPDIAAITEEADGYRSSPRRAELEAACGLDAASGPLAAAGGRQLILRVDRVELSKNILRGFWAYEELLETRPEWRERVVLLAVAYPSREGLADYLAYRSEIEHLAARINETWATDDWTPIVLDVADDRERSVIALTRYDVLLVNPIRDGLNLVAKEGPLVNERDGVLVLSREAGAWDELAPAALGINPYDITDTADALDRALRMGAEERAARAATVRELVRGRTAADWLADQVAAGS